MENVSTSEQTVKLKKAHKPGKFMAALASQKGYLYLLPAFIFLLIFTIYPIINTVLVAFMNNYDGAGMNLVFGSIFDGQDGYIGFDGFGIENFKMVVQYPAFQTALTNTLIFAFISVPISLLLALLISVWLNNIKWLQKAYQTIFFLPYLTNAIAIGAVFMAMFNMVQSGDGYSSIGLVNTILGWFGIQPINWVNIGANVWAQRTVVLLYSIWNGLPFKILIIFSALQSVNKQYYDAAKIDGASKQRTLWKVTVPLISPMLSYLLVTGFMGGLKEYSSVLGIFGDKMGPNTATMQTMVGFIYEALSSDKVGWASAGAIYLFGIILVFTLLNLYLSKKRVHY